ncbi:MAG TPA: ATP-dependent helicase [Flavobacteriales bacterium]|nr:ATP-dependent helicase [Flavobacteriales bacterium]
MPTVLKINDPKTTDPDIKYDALFKDTLDALNPAQRTAVNQIEGPLLVVAGPGTGKTHLLAARIGQILKQTDAQAYNILCLTYTEAGTIAMRQRLLEFIGPIAYRVNIYTFHAFCNDIIQRYPDYFGNRDLIPISELETVDLLMKMIDRLDASNPIKRKKGKIYYEVKRMKDLFRRMKEESWTVKHLENCIDAYLEDLPLREEYIYKRGNAKKGIKTGDIKQHLVDKELEKMTVLRAAVQLFPVFKTMMAGANRYDYNDMILWVLDAFKNDEDFLRIQQEKYHYFLVDEFQDTNGAQSEILEHLIDYWEEPNVFAVGDDDQSIYEFQGARMKNIMDFYHKFEKSIQVIVMEENYRSTQHILDSACILINNNRERLINQISGLKKELTAQNTGLAALPNKPNIKQYYNTKHEEGAIVDAIVQLQAEAVPLNEIAVVYRNHKQAEEIINLIEKKGISYNVVKRINILDLPMITKLIKLIEYIAKEGKNPYRGEHLLFEMMHFSSFKIASNDAAKVFAHCGRDWQLKTRDFINKPQNLATLNLQAPERISQFSENINSWIELVPNITFQELFGRIINQGGFLQEILNSPDKTWQMQVLITFFDFIKEESMKNPRLSISSFIEMLEKMHTNELELGVNKTIYEENGVNFLTAHSSKGLEFRHVFIIGATSNVWNKKKSGGYNAYSLPDTLTFSNEENALESSRRLFYVAMTRAKEHLQISFSQQDNKGKANEKTLFLAEILENEDLKIAEEHLSTEKLTALTFEGLEEQKTAEAPLLDTNYINSLLEKYTLSVTHLNKYLRCPVAFYYENIIRVPAAKNDAMAFGSAIHFALKRLFDKMLESETGAFPDKDEFIKDYLQEMRRNRASFSDQEFERRKELGEEVLPDYYDQYMGSWNKIVITEYDIKNIEMDGIPLNGKLDKIEFDKHNVNVVDYKTGKVSAAKKKLQEPNEKEPLGGEYWRQVVFYKILMDELRPKRWTMMSGEIDFIEKDDRTKKDFVKVKIPVTREGILLLKAQIKDTWQKIMNHEFSKGCEEDDCKWCSFVKNQFVAEKPLIEFEEA